MAISLQHNESYWFLTPQMLRLIKDKLTEHSFSTYPVYDGLRARLAAYAGVPNGSITLTPGSDAAISQITQALVSEGKTIALPVPTFYGYERILQRLKACVAPIPYRSGDIFEFPLEETVTCLQKGEAQALFLCHPNNPLGCTIPSEQLTAILDVAASANVFVLLDEAYLEFGGTSSAKRIGKQPLAIIRTMSKAFGLSGARVGYCISDAPFVASFSKSLLPWPVAHPSIAAALALLEQPGHIKERLRSVLDQRDLFTRALQEIGVRTYPSATNFVLARVPNAQTVADGLRNGGIYTAVPAVMTAYPDAQMLLHDTMRMAIPSPDDMPDVLAHLTSHLQ